MLEARRSTTGGTPWVVPFRAADPHKVSIDPNGNLASKTEGSDSWAYIWNAENQLTKVEKNGSEVARYGYDPYGRRVEKIAGGVATAYTYDGEDIIRETRGVASLKYVHGPGVDQPLASDDGSGLMFLHADAQGSVATVSDASGAIRLVRRYDAWGRLQEGTEQPGFAFTGREWDPEPGLYYYRARYYDAAAGRFISEDPLGFGGAINFYSYVGDLPTTEVDPSGLVATRGCTRQQTKAINSAVQRTKKKLKNCLPCTEDKQKWSDAMDNTTYNCDNNFGPTFTGPDGRKTVPIWACGGAWGPGGPGDDTGVDVTFYRGNFSVNPMLKPICGCLEHWVVHEVGHNVTGSRHPDTKVEDIANKCFACGFK